MFKRLSAAQIRDFLASHGYPASARNLGDVGINGEPQPLVEGPGTYDEGTIFGGANTPPDLTGQAPAAGVSPASIANSYYGQGANFQVTMATYPFTGMPVSLQVLGQNPNRALLIVQNLDTTTNMYVGFGTSASMASMVLLPTVGLLLDTKVPVDSVAIWFVAGAAKFGVVLEGVPYIPA